MKETKKPINQWIVTGVAVVIVGAISFFGGMKYQQGKPVMFNGRGNGQAFGGPNARFGSNGGGRTAGSQATVGEVVSIDDKSMTVKLMDGSTKIVLLSDSSTYSKSDSGTKSDVKTGIQVAVFGIPNSDGSVTAQNVQLNPQMRMFNRGGSTQSPSPSPAS